LCRKQTKHREKGKKREGIFPNREKKSKKLVNLRKRENDYGEKKREKEKDSYVSTGKRLTYGFFVL